MLEQQDERPGDDDLDLEPLDEGFDWTVLLGRIAGFVILGATLGTSYDVSVNQGQDWLTVMRVAIQPFALGVIILALVEMLDRRGD